MRKHFTKKRVIVLAIVALAIGITAGALAYFTTTGSGSGTATAGSAGTVTLHATFGNGLVPGTSETVSFTADNPGATTLVQTISFGSVESADTGCQAVIGGALTQFHMDAVTSNTTVAHGALGFALNGTGTLVWDNLPTTDQTECAGAPLTLHVTSN
jgi:hypothetical protein